MANDDDVDMGLFLTVQQKRQSRSHRDMRTPCDDAERGCVDGKRMSVGTHPMLAVLKSRV